MLFFNSFHLQSQTSLLTQLKLQKDSKRGKVMANKILESSSNELAVPKSSISGLPRVKRQPLSPGTAAFCSLGLLTFQESWANGTLGRTKVKLVNGPVNGPTLAPALHTPCWGTWAKLKPCISISEAPALSTHFAFGSGRYFFPPTSKDYEVLRWMDALIYYSMNSLGFLQFLN